MALLLVYLFSALIISFLCSITEAVLLSVSPSYLQTRIDSGDQNAAVVLNHKKNIDKPLSAILSLNTIAHTIGAAGVGAQAILVFGEAYFGLVSAILTLLILVLTEIIPKTLGANHCKQLTGFTARMLRLMIVVAYPLVVASSLLTRWLSRNKDALTTSREEISALASIGTEEGIFAEKENKIIQNLIRLKRIPVSEIMTPRVVVVTANEEMTAEEFLENKDFLHFSRIPIYHKNKDQITGYVLRSEVFEELAADQFQVKLKDIKRKILTFPSNMSLFRAWDELLGKREHISLVVDQYGGMNGITTLEDIIESLLGFEIIDEKDRIEDMQQYALERWKEKQKKYDLLKHEEK